MTRISDLAEAMRAAVTCPLPYSDCKACGSTAHRITQCPQIARFDPVTHLRLELANLHEALGCALALVRQESYGAAEIILSEAMKGSGPSAFAALRARIEEIRADYPSDVFPGDAGRGARMAIERVLALFALEETR